MGRLRTLADVIAAAPYVLLVWAGHRCCGLYRISRWLFGRPLAVPLARWPAAAEARWHARTVALQRVARRLPGAACLVRASSLAWWMRRHRLPARVVIGVAPPSPDQPPGLPPRPSEPGHAWVECLGCVFDHPADAHVRFVPIDGRGLFGPPPR